MTSDNLCHDALQLWSAGDTLGAGRLLYEALPLDERPAWAANLLELSCSKLAATPSEVQTVRELALSPRRWREAHAAFEAVRRLVLKVEQGRVNASELLQGTLYLAENVAKVTYNATGPADPFDADAGWWVAANVAWIAARLHDPSFQAEAWRRLCKRLSATQVDGTGAVVTDPTAMVLTTSGGNLVFAADRQGVGGWCQVRLLTAGVSHSLGAETLKYIAAHLRSFLTDATPGRRWVFSLSELHGSAYGEHVGTDAILHFQDADGKMVASLVLTPDEKAHWVRELSQWSGG